MKEVIKQIEKIKGVKTVESYCDKAIIVTFEAEKYAVECTNSEQCKFIHIQNSWEHNPTHAAINGSIFLRLTHRGWDSRRKYCEEEGNTVISFTQYLKDYNLQSEWEKYNEVELVKGEIYLSDAISKSKMIFRYKGKSKSGNYWADYYSLQMNSSFFTNDDLLHTGDDRKLVDATDKQKRKLIKAEVKNGYFHELR